MKPKVQFHGRLVADAKKFDKNGVRMVFTVVCNTKTKDGELTDYYPCVVFGEDWVNRLLPWMKKGRLIVCSGEVNSHRVRDGAGKITHTQLEFNVKELEFLDRKPEGREAPKPQQQALDGDLQKAFTQMMQEFNELKAQMNQQAAQPVAQPAAQTASAAEPPSEPVNMEYPPEDDWVSVPDDCAW